MGDSQQGETEMPGAELAGEFWTWIERVTQHPSTDYQARHRAEGPAV